jgi:hypothetical protein
MRLENSVLHLVVTGIVQCLFDMAFNVDSTVQWESSSEGNLEVEIRSRG